MMRDPQSVTKLKSLMMSFNMQNSTTLSPGEQAFTPISVQPQQPVLDIAPPQIYQPLPQLAIKLNGKQNFKDWKALLEVSLQAMGLDQYLDMDTISQSHAQLAKRTLSYIAMNCDMSILRSIRQFQTPKAAYDYLESQYGSNQFSEFFDAT